VTIFNPYPPAPLALGRAPLPPPTPLFDMSNSNGNSCDRELPPFAPAFGAPTTFVSELPWPLTAVHANRSTAISWYILWCD
jgi:hypothetical protein